MKYCPHCGASLEDGAFSFCPDCGKELALAEVRNEKESRKRKSSKKAVRQAVETPPPVKDEPKDDYDGYYDDVAPLDAGKAGEGFDRDLMKKVVGMVCGVLVVVGACIALMYFL